jgi:tRNA G37 N-methylase Trm5
MTATLPAPHQKFQHAKEQCLYGHKRDKSSVGQYDTGVMEICTLINEHFREYYTTSSCAGRCFLYTGMGIKATTTFVRCRISHGPIQDSVRYFDLSTIQTDPTGGGDPIPQIYDGGKRQRQRDRRQQQQYLQGQSTTPTDTADTAHDVNSEELNRGDERYCSPERIGNDDDAEYEDKDQEDALHTVPTNTNTNTSIHIHADSEGTTSTADEETQQDMDNDHTKTVWWLRYEPFILHVACRSLHAAVQLMNRIRPIFKAVGITSLSSDGTTGTACSRVDTGGCPKYVVAVYGDEGLDMPLTNEYGISMIATMIQSGGYTSQWLASLINERYLRNRNKIERLVQAIQNAIPKLCRENDNDDDNIHLVDDTDDAYHQYGTNTNTEMDHYPHFDTNQNVTAAKSSNATHITINGQQIRIPRSYDVIGDVAILHTLPDRIATQDNEHSDNDSDQVLWKKAIGDAILQRNHNIKVVVARSSNLDGSERAPGINGIQVLTGPIDRIQRIPLITTHREYGVSCIVNIHHTFFSPRMGQERIRICEQIGVGNDDTEKEHVLILFAGICMDAFLIAARTDAISVTAIESNEHAIACARKGHLMLERNKICIDNHAAQRLQIIHGDCLQVIPILPSKHYHRIVAPRPKEGNLDGNQPPRDHDPSDESTTADDTGSGGGREFLIALLSVLKPNGGICHWYDFCADHEYPQCVRTVQFLSDTCQTEYQYDIEVVHIAHVGSVAKRQVSYFLRFLIVTLPHLLKQGCLLKQIKTHMTLYPISFGRLQQLRICVDFRISPTKS